MAATFESFKHRWPQTLEFPSGGASFPLSRRFVWSMRLVCLTALAVTGYLALTALRSEEVAGCGSGVAFDCSFVLHSRWSKVLGLPVSIPAFALYVVLLSAISFPRRLTRSHLQLAWGLVTVGAIAAGLSALWFIGLQLFVVRHLCMYCLAAHLCGLALCAAVLWKQPLGGRVTARLAGLSVLGVSVLLGAQLLSAPPQTYQVERYTTDVAANSTPASTTDAPGATHPEKNTPAKQQEKGTAAKQDKSRAANVFEPPAGVPDDDEK
jgi:uncharacterized membrane protein